jgi:hypothetical protein
MIATNPPFPRIGDDRFRHALSAIAVGINAAADPDGGRHFASSHRWLPNSYQITTLFIIVLF